MSSGQEATVSCVFTIVIILSLHGPARQPDVTVGRLKRGAGPGASAQGRAAPTAHPGRAKPHRGANQPQQRPAPTDGRMRVPRGTTTPNHRPTKPAVGRPIEQHRPAGEAAGPVTTSRVGRVAGGRRPAPRDPRPRAKSATRDPRPRAIRASRPCPNILGPARTYPARHGHLSGSGF